MQQSNTELQEGVRNQGQSFGIDEAFRFSGAATPTLKSKLDLKRIVDVVGATLFGIILLPIWVGVAVVLWFGGKRKILFQQERVGLLGKPFTMYKFCTMSSGGKMPPAQFEQMRQDFIAELEGRASADPASGLYKQQSEQVTPVGRFLRKYSIDEIPQLLNVLRGEMSLVGPRPAVVWEAELFSSRQQRRHTVKPGMTGLWQVSGRNLMTTAQMIELDLSYVETQSLWQDLAILLRTPWAMLLRKATR
jgi:lipopolysaccharide/colanic/teichoic acid biosynthesis glycosyltransferase